MLKSNFTIKPLKWFNQNNYSYSHITISNIIDTDIKVIPYKNIFNDIEYQVIFTNCNWGNFNNIKNNSYTKYGFKDIEEGKAWAEKEYNNSLYNCINNILYDLNKYIKEI